MLENNIKNIINLSNLFIKENKKYLSLINRDNNKVNKKSLLFWAYIALFCGIFYLSSEIIDYMNKIGKPEIFLNLFLLFLQILVIIRTIMVSINIFFFSKDIENIIHLPFKAVEILVAKLFTIIYMNYEIELLFGAIPLIIYGIYRYVGILYYINVIFILIIFPIFSVLAISIIEIFLMKIIKHFKNKDFIQILISLILVCIIMIFTTNSLKYVFNNSEYIEKNQTEVLNNINEKLLSTNKFFISINPAYLILQQNEFLVITFNYLKLIIMNLIAFLVFVFIGNKFYLKQLLKLTFYYKEKKNKKININKRKYKVKYINKEFKMLFKQPLFFTQCVYSVVIYTIFIIMLIIGLVPRFREVALTEEYKEMTKNMKFDIEVICIIVGTLQTVGLFNYSSITAFSREGKNSFLIKVLPISLYKQFIYKNIPQIVINTICSIFVFITIVIQIPEIEKKYICIMFFISFLMYILNSFILTIIDLMMPRFDWEAEYEILKNNKNKILQYFLIILNVLFFVYLAKFFTEKNLKFSLLFIIIFLVLTIIAINFIIIKFEKKLFKNIS